MLRAFNLKHILVTSNNLVNLQSVRWRRKPRWVPVARSKMFRIPPRSVTPEEEKIELMRLYNNYRTHMKGIRSYLHSEYNVKSAIIDTEVHEKEFLKDFEACNLLNNAWNEEIRKQREARHAKELEETKRIAYERLNIYLETKEIKLEKIEEIVRREKEFSKNYITPDNIDQAIEVALANQVDYNYAIDLNGNIYRGRTAKPEEVKQKEIKENK